MAKDPNLGRDQFFLTWNLGKSVLKLAITPVHVIRPCHRPRPDQNSWFGSSFHCQGKLTRIFENS